MTLKPPADMCFRAIDINQQRNSYHALNFRQAVQHLRNRPRAKTQTRRTDRKEDSDRGPPLLSVLRLAMKAVNKSRSAQKRFDDTMHEEEKQTPNTAFESLNVQTMPFLVNLFRCDSNQPIPISPGKHTTRQSRFYTRHTDRRYLNQASPLPSLSL